VLLALNLLILALTGARAPLAIALAVVALTLAVAPSPRLAWGARVPMLLGGAVLAVLLGLLAEWFAGIRIFNLLLREPANLSGRDVIWPVFQAAWEESPWYGWGVGAAKSLVALDSPIARLLGTNAAHNEYLRIGVEGGYVGLGLLILFLTLWTRAHLRATCGSDRAILLLVLIGFAVHSYTDNTLIATTSSVFLTWINACFARAARETESPRLT
jgi:O-antigen ligase